MNTYYFFQDLLPKIDWVAVLALVVAIVSVILSVRFNRRTLKLTEEHNKKTVEPFLTDHYFNNSEDPDQSKKIQVYLIRNCGPGPAIIKSLKFHYENEEFEDMESFFQKHIESDSSYQKLLVTKIGNFHILAPDDSIELFNFVCTSDLRLRKLLEINEKVGIHIIYTSIYGDEKVFHRNAIYYDKEFVKLKD